MDELSFAEETIDRMKDLYGLAGNHAVVRRTIISRIYYSAHHLSRYLLRRVGLRPETWRRNVHQRVIDEIHRQFVATNMMNAQMIPLLRDMRRNRINADYQLRTTISEGDVEDMFDMFDVYLNECRRLLEVIT
ncbi:TPA: hypothetical protein EYP66_20265 [Candidatus Poribacteria bacterium]|nr:hypothetical protein [Candidatus Poribacteria bacterium]